MHTHTATAKCRPTTGSCIAAYIALDACCLFDRQHKTVKKQKFPSGLSKTLNTSRHLYSLGLLFSLSLVAFYFLFILQLEAAFDVVIVDGVVCC